MTGGNQKPKSNDPSDNPSAVESTSSLCDQKVAGQQGQIPPLAADLSLHRSVPPRALQISPTSELALSSNYNAEYQTALQRAPYRSIPPSGQQVWSTESNNFLSQQAASGIVGHELILPPAQQDFHSVSIRNSSFPLARHSSHHRRVSPSAHRIKYQTTNLQNKLDRSRASAQSAERVLNTVSLPAPTSSPIIQVQRTFSGNRAPPNWTLQPSDSFFSTLTPHQTLESYHKRLLSAQGDSSTDFTFTPRLQNRLGGHQNSEQQAPTLSMVGKKSGKALLREEGLERTDNGMKQTSWPEVPMINQKNYYTEYMKRDDQILSLRSQNEANRERMIRNAKDKDRALARTGNTDVPLPTNGDVDLEDEDAGASDGFDASKVIVIHPGSQNLRIGFASDALPKSIPMTIAYKYVVTESEDYNARPKRQKLNTNPDQQFGEEFSKKVTKMSNDLKIDMRANKRKVLPNSKELVVNYNRRTEPEKILEHNDPLRIEWTDVSKDDPKDKSTFFTGMEALRIPDDSNPKYKLFWPMQHGVFNENEKDYTSREGIFQDLDSVLEHALRNELGLKSSAQWEEFSCVFVIPDLYDKRYVEQVLNMCLTSFGFKQVCFVQESLAATYGAGYTSACIVDIGAQKTSMCCVEDGMCIEDSRINLKYGGYDVTETFIKMLLYDHFPYADINLKRRYDFLLAEELKINFCTMNQAEISVQLYNFHLRAPNQPTRKYQFKCYDEVILAPTGFFDPSLFDNSEKLAGRRKFIDRSYNAYDVDMPDDPTSSAQLSILTTIKPSLATTASGFSISNGNGNADIATPSKEKPNPLNFLSRMDSEANGASRVTSAAGSPAPEGANTPIPSGPFVQGANVTNGGSPGPSGGIFQFGNGSHNSGTPVPAGIFVDQHARTQRDFAIERDSVLPIAPLDTAIITCITHAAKGDEKKVRDFFGGIMVIGGGAKTPGFGPYLEEKLKTRRRDLADKILVGTSPREMDGQVVVWKGASVFGRMKNHESWVGQLEYERLGSRTLYTKALWHY